MEEMNNIYEEQVINEENEALIPVEAEEEAGMGTGVVVLLTAAATAGAIWLGGKVKNAWANRKSKKAAKEAEEVEAEVDVEPAAEEEVPEA